MSHLQEFDQGVFGDRNLQQAFADGEHFCVTPGVCYTEVVYAVHGLRRVDLTFNHLTEHQPYLFCTEMEPVLLVYK